MSDGPRSCPSNEHTPLQAWRQKVGDMGTHGRKLYLKQKSWNLLGRRVGSAQIAVSFVWYAAFLNLLLLLLLPLLFCVVVAAVVVGVVVAAVACC